VFWITRDQVRCLGKAGIIQRSALQPASIDIFEEEPAKSASP
jgi:hypothetical protein